MGRVYDRASFRALPRERCEVAALVGGDCSGVIGHHHVVPISLGGDPYGPTVSVCAAHHPMLEAVARRVHGEVERPLRRCRHRHPTAAGREACERRLNATA